MYEYTSPPTNSVLNSKADQALQIDIITILILKKKKPKKQTLKPGQVEQKQATCDWRPEGKSKPRIKITYCRHKDFAHALNPKKER